MTATDKAQSTLFDPGDLGHRRDRAMRLGYVGGGDFLMVEIAARLAERLAEIRRDFDSAVLAGTGAGAIAAALPPALATGAGVAMTDPSALMLTAARAALPQADILPWAGETLPFQQGEAALALSTGLMHALNDPVGHLVQLRLALCPDGLMIAAAAGGETLLPLRQALAEAEIEVTGGLSPRIAPMGEIRQMGALLQRAGFAMPVADSDVIEVTHADAWALMRDLRAMGETNILSDRLRRPTSRRVFARAAEILAERVSGRDGRIRTRFEIVFLTGWAPAPDQPRPLRPGSAAMRLSDALGTVEHAAGEKAGTGPDRR
ncbi:MAG: methyltransferase domain-containing protein [Pseudomonadota bacterium]